MSESRQQFRIESGVPLPELRAGRPNTYPFGEMSVGDSFLFEGDIRPVRHAAHMYGRRNNRRFTTRKHENGGRVWRIA